MEKLVASRANYRGQLTRFGRFLSTVTEENFDRTIMEVRHDSFIALKAKFEDLQEEIECLLEVNKREEAIKVRILFEEEYFQAEALYRDLMKKYSREADSMQYRSMCSSQEMPVKLPVLKVPLFDGSITGYRSFRNIFDSLINDNSQLNTIQKFVYLRSSLVGDAVQIIDSLEICDMNYYKALELLDLRYNNVRAVTQAHIKNIMELPTLKFKSLSGLRMLIDQLNHNLSALSALKEPVKQWSSLLVYMILSKIDQESRELFEMSFDQERMPNIDELVRFLMNRCASMESLERHVSNGKDKIRNVRSFSTTIQNRDELCVVCKSDHKIFRCPQFLSWEPKRRFEFAKKRSLCIQCLNDGHQRKDCSFRLCSKCNGSHNILLHFDSHVKDVSSLKNDEIKYSDKVANMGTALHSIKQSSDVLLLTAQIRIQDKFGVFRIVRGVIDPGSQVNVVSTRLTKILKLNTKPVYGQVNGFGKSSCSINKYSDLVIHSLAGDFSIPVQAFVCQTITENLPHSGFDADEMFENLKLADPDYNVPREIDFLLSNAVYARILKPGIICSSDNKRKAINTELGYLICGLNETHVKVNTNDLVSLSIVNDFPSVEDQLEKFWLLNEVKTKSPDVDDPCEDRFKNNHTRTLHGKFCVELPFAIERFDFSYSRTFALQRFLSLEKRFRSNSMLKDLYVNFMSEYAAMNHMTLIPDKLSYDKDAYYIPHHGVLTYKSDKPKLRVVFDGSSAPSNCTSINSVLHAGPKLQNDLTEILIRFRLHKYAFITDITKMFRMIEVNNQHRKYQRICWREREEDPIQYYELNTVTYGLKSSPYLAIRCLKQLCQENAENYPVASRMVLNDSYVDDIVSGFGSEKEMLAILPQLIEMMQSGGFPLHKWVTNVPDVLSRVIDKELMCDSIDIDNDNCKVLGIKWYPLDDQFSFGTYKISYNYHTKRSILAQIAGLFDPLGLIGPVILKGKLLIQELWLNKMDWDVEVPETIHQKWIELVSQLDTLSEIRVERHVNLNPDSELIGYCDASQNAYGACVYLKTADSKRLIISRSKVAPIKLKLNDEALSIARLELLGAVLLVELMNYTQTALSMSTEKCRLYTDSQIVLAWIAKPSYTWKVFVANRVEKIQKLFPRSFWAYVPTLENPADILSRGCNPKEIIKLRKWWDGPPNDVFKQPVESNTVLELKPVSLVSLRLSVDFIKQFSSYTKCIRVNAYVLRFIKNCKRNPDVTNVGELTRDELDQSLLRLIYIIQQLSFDTTINRIKSRTSLPRSDSLISLNPIIDEHGFLRVGGRLSNAKLPYSVQHPLILPKNNHFVQLLIQYEHQSNQHIGIDSLVVLLRQRFWILNSRAIVRQVVRSCIRCFRVKPLPGQQLMGDLPESRVELIRPFLKVGVDYCGPFKVKPFRMRGGKTMKAYIAVFICFGTKAVHIEFVSDLTTESFLAALDRFAARRGIPSEIWSDNGRNFIGASAELKSLYQYVKNPQFQSRMKSSFNNQIKWNFIPARTPSFGGLWERSIQSLKRHMLRCVGAVTLTVEEFLTLITKIEAILNSRPLCQITNNAENAEALTPGHFLIGAHLKSIPVGEESTRPLGQRWRMIKELSTQLWNRWHKEYLTGLQVRYRNQSVKPSIKVGDVGLLVEENLRPLEWPLAVVIRVFPGKDGLVRTIEVRCHGSIFQRGVNKFCQLPDFQ